jgi:hypothetical protein
MRLTHAIRILERRRDHLSARADERTQAGAVRHYDRAEIAAIDRVIAEIDADIGDDSDWQEDEQTAEREVA